MADKLKIRQQLEFCITTAGVSLEYEQKLTALLEECDEKELSFLFFFLSCGDINKPPVTEEADAPLSMSLGKMLEIARALDNNTTSLTNKQVYTTLVSTDALKDKQTQKNLLRSVWLSMDGGYPEVALAIVESLEKVTNDKLQFSGFSADDVLLFRKMYVFLVYHYFSVMPDSTKLFFLNSPLLILALMADFDVRDAIARHITSYDSVEIRHSIIINFASALIGNDATVGKNIDGRPMKTRDWIRKFAIGVENDMEEGAIENFAASDKDVLVNTFLWHDIIRQIIELYFCLVSGDFVLDARGRALVDRMLSLVPKEHVADFDKWIVTDEAKQNIKECLKMFSIKRMARFGLTGLLSALGVDLLKDEKNITAILELTVWLKDSDLIDDEDLIYFDDNSNHFEWVKP